MDTSLAVAAPSLDEVKDRIFSDHRQIVILLDELVDIVTSISEGSDVQRKLTDPIWRFYLVFDEHLRLEEKELVPRLWDTGAWAAIRVTRLEEEHRAQRAALLAMIKKCGVNPSPQELVDDVRSLVDSFRRDIASEEEQLETIRDDGVVVDQFTG